jgi:hypothetical protein
MFINMRRMRMSEKKRKKPCHEINVFISNEVAGDSQKTGISAALRINRKR